VPAVIWGILGVIGVVYSILVARRVRTQTAYQPVFEDWLFHFLLPVVAYATLAISAYEAHATKALFAVAAAALLLLFVGIHNAWDAVTYHVLVKRQRRAERD